MENKRKNKIDWEERDFKILKEIQEVITNLYALEKPVYVNKTRVAKSIRKLSMIEKNIDKLPRSKDFLSKNLETREQYHIRKIMWACKKIFLDEGSIVNWKIKRLACIKNEEKVDTFIKETKDDSIFS